MADERERDMNKQSEQIGHTNKESEQIGRRADEEIVGTSDDEFNDTDDIDEDDEEEGLEE